jgi:hypothetical protein
MLVFAPKGLCVVQLHLLLLKYLLWQAVSAGAYLPMLIYLSVVFKCIMSLTYSTASDRMVPLLLQAQYCNDAYLLYVSHWLHIPLL